MYQYADFLEIAIKDNVIVVKNIEIDQGIGEIIRDVCHKNKHLYLDGYPHGHRARKKFAGMGVYFDKWEETPKICITYWFQRPDKESTNEIEIHAVVSNTHKYAPKEVAHFLAKWQQDVVDGLLEALDNL